MEHQIILASEFISSFKATKQILQSDKKDKTVVLITTASHGEGFDPDYETNIKPFEEMGYKVVIYDLAGKKEKDVEIVLNQADVIYACGGNSFYLLEHMIKCNFKKLLTNILNQGTIYIGSSAGAIVCSPDISYIEPMDDPSRASERISTGLNLIDFLFLPHLDHAFHGETAKRILKDYTGNTQMIALRDSQALVVQGKGVTIIDGEHPI